MEDFSAVNQQQMTSFKTMSLFPKILVNFTIDIPLTQCHYSGNDSFYGFKRTKF